MQSETILRLFERRLKLQRYAESTVKAYLSNAVIFLNAFAHYSDLKDIPISAIEAFINQKVEVDYIGASHQKALVGSIKKLYLLVESIHLNLNYLYPKRAEHTLPKYFTKEEVVRILAATENLKHKAILTTIYSCGLRLNELIMLKIEDLHSNEKILKINQGKGNKDRIVAMPEKLLLLLREYYKVYRPQEYLFEGADGGTYSERSVQLVLK